MTEEILDEGRKNIKVKDSNPPHTHWPVKNTGRHQHYAHTTEEENT